MTQARSYAQGIGEAVADRTINRKIAVEVPLYYEVAELPRRDDTSLDDAVRAYCKANNLVADNYDVIYGDDLIVRVKMHVTGHVVTEQWADVAERVAEGNASLEPRLHLQDAERQKMRHHLRQASLLMSGRHLQHGDRTQATRPMEVFTNCGRYDTEVMTLEKGVVKIGEVVGELLTVRTADGEWRPAKFNEHGEQKLYELTFVGKNGRGKRVVHFTRNHRWLLKAGTFTDNIQVGDVLMPAPTHTVRDPAAVVHGLIFGDGSAHKGRRDGGRPGISVGRTYASIRVCKQDAVRDEIHAILDDAGYNYTTPPHANGDRVYYIGKLEYAKELPFTRDPDYIAGFIYGWWLADGHKTEPNGTWTISTSDTLAFDWLKEHSVIAGLSVVSCCVKQRKDGDGSYANGKDLNVIRLREGVEWKLSSIEEGEVEKVYCPEEPVTSTFILANGLLTGNCSTSATTFLTFYLLLNGSGVGRAYDDKMIVADLNYLPIVVPVIDQSHADVQSGEIRGIDLRTAKHLYAERTVHVFEVPDSREGWAKALEKMETMAFQRVYRDDVLILDFSKVRPRGAPIAGMQGRPASGPAPLMSAIQNVATLRDAGMAPWRAAMYADHYIAECVLVGGARRAARMATKFWKDPTVLDFIQVKRGGFLWSSNNSVTVDEEFWRHVDNASRGVHSHDPYEDERQDHAWKVFNAICDAAYNDGTGEPGIINADKLTWNDEGTEALLDGNFAESGRYRLNPDSLELTKELVKAWLASDYKVITNPCGEIVLGSLGGYCVIADVVPYHSEPIGFGVHTIGDADEYVARWDEDAEDAFRTATRALIRTNLMDSLYGKEVVRTNRIGVGMTGLHEYAWERFGYGFRDIIDENKSKDFWLMLSRFKRAVQDEAKRYAEELGVAVPHTNTTIKPAGTTSKLFGLTEGAHLPSMREYLRWVQFRNDDPLVEEYRAKGYPIRKLRTYSGTTIVGFPTQPLICTLGMGDKLVTAAEATPEEQYQYLRLLEKYWITGVEEDGVTPLEERGNQVSYTLKFDPAVVDFETFKRTLLEGQATIRCCSVMPQVDATSYEYQPEQPVSKAEYELIRAAIKDAESVKEDIGLEHVDCGSGGCPIDFASDEVA